MRDLPNSFVDALKQQAPDTPIDLALAKTQHQAYVTALKDLGLRVIEVAADESLPDCCFVEDTAVVIGGRAAINNLGAKERQGEEKQINKTLKELGIETFPIEAPGTVDGGDVLFTGKHLIIGLSKRTNAEGARQLGQIFSDVPSFALSVTEGLHLKSVLSAFDSETLLFGECAAAKGIEAELRRKTGNGMSYEIIYLPDPVGANVLSIGDFVVIQDGFPRSEVILKKLAEGKNKTLIKLQMSEFIKADGALTCCSLLF